MRWISLLLVLAACRGDSTSNNPPPPDSDGFPYPPPRTDVFPAIGSADTLEVAAWNIENFPDMSNTPKRVADIIASLDLDIVMVEEIASETAWRELLARLRDYDGVLSEHRYSPTEYQKLGIIYRRSMVTSSAVSLMFVTSGYEFPRPPLTAELTVNDGVHAPLAFRVIGLHLKAGVAVEDGDRRRLALQELDTNLRDWLAQPDNEDEIVIAGDYNEVVTSTTGRTNMASLLDAPDLYTVHTAANAANGEISFVPSAKLIDHITTTAGFADELAGARLVIPRLQTLTAYTAEVSDHLPVVLVTPLR